MRIVILIFLGGGGTFSPVVVIQEEVVFDFYFLPLLTLYVLISVYTNKNSSALF
jgi:hypothetical protein